MSRTQLARDDLNTTVLDRAWRCASSSESNRRAFDSIRESRAAQAVARSTGRSLLLLASLSAAASAQKTPSSAFERHHDLFGDRICDAGDVDGDGVRDLLVSAPFASVDGKFWCGEVFVVSGRNGRALRVIRGSVEHGMFGSSLASDSLRAGSGPRDFAVAFESYEPGESYVELRDGANGALRLTVRATPDDLGLGRALCFAPDLDGDGRDDLAVSSLIFTGRNYVFTEELAGRVRVFSTRDGSVLRTWTSEHNPLDFGRSITLAPDQDRDGLEDLLVESATSGVSTKHTLTMFSTCDERPLFELTIPTCDDWSQSRIAFADVDGDQVPDLVVGSPSGWDSSTMVSHALVFAGTTHAEIRRWSRERFEFGYSLASAGDVNHDGHVDVLVGDQDLGCASVELISGADGATLQRWPTPLPDESLYRFGFSMALLGDVDGDGLADFAFGDCNANNPSAPGFVRAVSATGRELWTTNWKRASSGR